MESAAALHIGNVLKKLREGCPSLQTHVAIGSEPELLELLMERSLDMAVTACIEKQAAFNYEPAYSERMIFIAREDPADIIASSDMYPPALLAFNEGCPYRTLATEWLVRKGIRIARVQSVATYAGIVECAAAGMGLAMIPGRLLELSELSAHGVRRYRPEGLDPVTSYVVSRKGWQPDLIAQAAMRQLRESLAQVAGALPSPARR